MPHLSSSPRLRIAQPPRLEERYDFAALREAASGLSPRQAAILAWIAHGFSNEEIAMRIGGGMKTVEAEVTRILRVFGVASRLQAAVIWTVMSMRGELNGSSDNWSQAADSANFFASPR